MSWIRTCERITLSIFPDLGYFGFYRFFLARGLIMFSCLKLNPLPMPSIETAELLFIILFMLSMFLISRYVMCTLQHFDRRLCSRLVGLGAQLNLFVQFARGYIVCKSIYSKMVRHLLYDLVIISY